MVKLCTFPLFFLIFSFLNLSAINGFDNIDGIVQDTENAEIVSKDVSPDGIILNEQNEDENYHIPNVCFDNTNYQPPRYIGDNKDYLYNQIGEISNSFSTNLNKYTKFMHELYGLYNEKIDVSMDNFRHGYIFMQIHFSKHKNEDSTVKLMVDLYGSVNKIHSSGIELAQWSFEAQLNQCELAQNKINVSITDEVFMIQDNDIVKGDQNASTQDNTNLQNAGSPNKLNNLNKIHALLMENNIDSTESFIALDKISEDTFQVNKLEDFLSNCMIFANTNTNNAELKKHKTQQERQIYRETLFTNFKQSIVSKDMENCKKNYALLISNSSIPSKLMYVFILIAAIIYIL
ncbi:conserved Plasmodium protein, unknown function [Plasmodium vinckei vinckei]|uniref:Secreted ookinete protein 25 n=1 Tax=Plasmodium vinckei vinckei TaxID=54757 RepID=A0A449BV62_PLAVN|nr:conserved Plasmodium protein, unknown function [Plasmodium vinckei vinckei]KEG02685.1 hypothetical protein YYE_02517 [Plasmodium vinckei vinckei]VEV57318.1 conserved Plasmodium protein, unknown function [Plasmodium vinckei vinckei]